MVTQNEKKEKSSVVLNLQKKGATMPVRQTGVSSSNSHSFQRRGLGGVVKPVLVGDALRQECSVCVCSAVIYDVHV